MTRTAKPGPVMRRLLRVIPFAGSESITPIEAAARAEMEPNAVAKLLDTAVKRGFVVRLRKGDYWLAPKGAP